MPKICDFKAIQPFSFDQGMKGFDAGIVIRITFMAVAALHVFGSFSVCFRNILAAAVTVNDQRQIGSAPCFCFLDGVDDAGHCKFFYIC